MLKVKQKITSILVACATALFAIVLAIGVFNLTPNTTASAETTITFTLGADGSASHSDGSSKTTYSETVGDYTLTLTNVSNFYTGARDAIGNGCIKLGASSKTGGFSFTVPDNVTSAIISVSGYKANVVTVVVNGSSQSIDTTSSTGNYTDITVDTTENKTVTFVTSTKYRAMVNTITYVIAGSGSETPDCEHTNTTETTVDATCTAEGSITVTCNDCGETVSTEEIPALGHNIENLEYTREGDQHTAEGLCTVCEETITKTEDCTLSYENVSNDDGTHNTTSTCSVCNQSITTENVDCTFDEGVLDGTILTYTCEYCEYSYTETATMYTVTYVVPSGIAEVENASVAAGYSTTIPGAGTIEGYTFVGWVEAELTEKQETAPEYLTAGTEYTVTANVTFYALYSRTEGTGAWTKVTDAATLAAGKQIVITASDYDFALSTTQNNNNRGQAAITKDGDTITFGNDVQVITLEEGSVVDTFAFNVGETGYLYAASSGSNYLRTQGELNANASWSIEINGGVATIIAQGSNTRNLLQYNQSSALFSCYASDKPQKAINIYMKDGTTYYVTEFNTCTHEHTKEVIEDATCTQSGSRTVTCLDCESVIEAEILSALGHNYVEGTCENCGLQDPASIVYNGYFYLILSGNKYLDTTTLDKYDRYKPVEFTPSATIEWNYVFYFKKSGDVYEMYDLNNGLYMSNLTITTSADYVVNIFNSEGNILSHNASANYIGFYKTSNSYVRDFTLVAVDAPATITQATVSIGDDLKLNYYVSMADTFASAEMLFTVDGDEMRVTGEKVGEQYKFTLSLAPQYMATDVEAELFFNNVMIASKYNYSIKQYAQNQLNKIEAEEITEKASELKQLLTDMLAYGAAAQEYKNYNVENLANADVDYIGTASEAVPAESDSVFNIASESLDSYGAWFTAANVWFGDVNKIIVKINTTDNVTLKINHGEEFAVTSTTILTDGIKATGFADTYIFELFYNGELMQTLTYSVNSYIYKTLNSTNDYEGKDKMIALVKALYNYGESAENFAQ